MESWDYSDDYREAYHVRETPHGIFRAVVELDEYPDAPDFEYGCPVYRLDYRRGTVDGPECGTGSDRASGVDIRRAMDHFHYATGRMRDSVDMLDRWLRIYHGGSCEIISSSTYQGGDDFLVYDTRAMREAWGQVSPMVDKSDPEASEWQAYIDGDVYVVSAQRAISFDEDGEPDAWEDIDGPVGGYYGEEWARDAAIEMLTWAIDSTARGMLPLGETA